ncbi:MAG: 30S ribosomal protein S1 [Alphaproteobacteria bacterium]
MKLSHRESCLDVGRVVTPLTRFFRPHKKNHRGIETMTRANAHPETNDDDFEKLLEDSLKQRDIIEGNVLKGRIVAIENDEVLIDVGLKSEGRVPLKEFSISGQDPQLKVGDEVEVYLEKVEDKNGQALLSREKAKREAVWQQLEACSKDNQYVEGTITHRVKGGFTVDLGGAIAFLPGSQVDIRPIKDANPLIGVTQPFQILKMDRARSNIVVSRRSIMEDSRAEARTELVANLEEGQVIAGIVKNITDYGAFIDLGGVDGLLHVTDIAWKRVNHPSDVLTVGQTVTVKIVRFNRETQRISLGLKQLDSDPWEKVAGRFPIGSRIKGRVTNVTDYGAFVELDEGIEGLIHVSEMVWSRKNISPSKIVSTSQEVEVMVLDLDMTKRRISLGLKQCTENPWSKIIEKYPPGTVFEGEIKNVTEFGLFVGMTDEVDGMVHLSDLSWEKPGEEALATYQKGVTIQVKVLDIDAEKERISLGVKQLTTDPYESKLGEFKKGAVVTCEVLEVLEAGIEVSLSGGTTTGFIRKGELSRERSEQRSSRFAVGEKVDAKIIAFDKISRKVNLSIKAREIEEDRQALATYGSSDSGASLGDILGAAMNRAQEKARSEAEDEAKD